MTKGTKSNGCNLCDTGFPIGESGQHYGTQSLGMIPTTPCRARKRAAARNRPRKRVCNKCKSPFVTQSLGRHRCYDCSPDRSRPPITRTEAQPSSGATNHRAADPLRSLVDRARQSNQELPRRIIVELADALEQTLDRLDRVEPRR